MAASSNISSRTKSVAFCGLTVALMTVSAWIVVPFGPVPFTLQVFVIVFALLALHPKDALASLGIYVLMGAIGLPVFSGMRGGLGVLAGPTGGFIWGFLLGSLASVALMQVWSSSKDRRGKERPVVFDVAVAAVFVAISYVCGWAQLAFVAGMGAQAAFAVGIAPFVLLDTAKVAFAVVIARAVRRAVRS